MKAKTRRILNIALIIVGVALFALAAFPDVLARINPFNTVLTDSTPPTYSSLYPANNQTYSAIAVLQVAAADPESAIASITGTVDGGSSYNLTRIIGTQYNGIFAVSIPALSQAQHTVTYVLTNTVDLKTTVTVAFWVYSGLSGTWSINNIVVTDPTATMRFNTTYLTFKFVKTLGAAPDANINCSISEGGDVLKYLTYQGASTWVGSIEFAGGTHVLTLRASDGANSVTMAMLNFDFGGISLSSTQVVLGGGGIACAGVGGYGFIIKKRR